MKVNSNSRMCAVAEITLDGENVVDKGHCMAGNEESGQVLMVKLDDRGNEVHLYDAQPGDLICHERVVEIRTGKVEIGFIADTEKHFDLNRLKKDWEEYSPLQVLRKIAGGDMSTEPAFEF